MRETPDDITRQHEERGDVRCEACGQWTSQAVPTLDDCYLCPTCAKSAPRATPDEIARYLGDE